MPAEARLDGSRALVTGGSGGIGRAVAARLARAGARVAITARRGGPLEHAARETGAVAIPADVTDADDVARLMHELTTRFDVLPDLLVNAAGAFHLAPVPLLTPEEFDSQIAVNLRAPFLLMRALLPGMLAGGRGHIVTIGSVAGRIAFPHNAAYSASKFGVRGLHAVLDAELRGTGVRATLIEPAATDTDLWDAIDRNANPDLPPRAAMLSVDAVADAVLYAATQPPETAVRNLLLERS